MFDIVLWLLLVNEIVFLLKTAFQKVEQNSMLHTSGICALAFRRLETRDDLLRRLLLGDVN